jgi:hypothetical protein
MRQADRVAPRECLQPLRQFGRARHLCVVHKHRDHAFLLRESGLDFDAHEVLGIVEASRSALVACRNPVLADHRDQHVAARDLIVQHLHKVEPGGDIVDVHEQPLGREGLFKSAVKRLSKAGIVAAAIVNENVAAHPSFQQAG